MSFFNELGHKVKNAGNQVSGKTKAFSDKTKVESEIRDINRQMDNIYLEMGKQYFALDQGDSSMEAKLKENVGNILSLQSQEEQKKAEIQEIESRIVCPNCGKYHPAGTKICECGYNFETGEMPAPIEPEQTVQQNGTEINPETDASVPRCPKCGEPLEPGAKFCIKCGTKIDNVEESSGDATTGEVQP